MNSEARMDARRAASDAVMASSGAHQARVTRYSESPMTAAPARCPFFCILFFGQAKKSMFQKLKRNFHVQSKERAAAVRTGSAVPLLKKTERASPDKFLLVHVNVQKNCYRQNVRRQRTDSVTHQRQRNSRHRHDARRHSDIDQHMERKH